ncbi:MAG: hypothetical protein U0T36_03550 [Saprospiraceae bacterium]
MSPKYILPPLKVVELYCPIDAALYIPFMVLAIKDGVEKEASSEILLIGLNQDIFFSTTIGE